MRDEPSDLTAKVSQIEATLRDLDRRLHRLEVASSLHRDIEAVEREARPASPPTEPPPEITPPPYVPPPRAPEMPAPRISRFEPAPPPPHRAAAA